MVHHRAAIRHSGSLLMNSTERHTGFSPSATFALMGILVGLSVAIFITTKNEYFWGNFAAYWLPQAAVLGVAYLFRAARAVLGGAAIALALYLAVFNA